MNVNSRDAKFRVEVRMLFEPIQNLHASIKPFAEIVIEGHFRHNFLPEQPDHLPYRKAAHPPRRFLTPVIEPYLYVA